MPIKQPGIILRIQAHPSTDPIGAFLPDHRTLYSLSHLSKNFAVISHTIKDQDLYGELARVVSAVSKLGAIKILTIEGHGSPQSITLNTGKEGKLSINGDPDPLKKAFKELPKDCKIILQSCSTGQGKENIAAYICAISQRTVFAPPASHIGYPDISYQQAPEHSKFQVTYWNGCSDFPASEFTFTG